MVSASPACMCVVHGTGILAGSRVEAGIEAELEGTWDSPMDSNASLDSPTRHATGRAISPQRSPFAI